MNQEEYTSLLDYLLTRLRNLQMNEIANEINLQINRGKIITISNADLKKKKIKYSELGKTQTLPLTSMEAFKMAIDYLSKIVIEVPSYAQSIREIFGTDILWEYDQTPSIKDLNSTDSILFKELSFSSIELEQAKLAISKINTLLVE